MTLDCLKCGACCASADGKSCCGVTAADKRRLGWWHTSQLMDKRTDVPGFVGSLRLVWRYLPPSSSVWRFPGDKLCCCVALEGQVDDAVRCRIYRRRPQACRDLKLGSEACHEFRKRIGL